MTWQKEYEINLALAERGTQVLTVPSGLSMDSAADLAQIGNCTVGIFGATHKLCQGNGTLFGIPAYVAVEKLEAGQLYSVTYTIQPPAKGMVLKMLTAHFGPPHRFDSLEPTTPPDGSCWPLPGEQEIVLENERQDDENPEIASMSRRKWQLIGTGSCWRSRVPVGPIRSSPMPTPDRHCGKSDSAPHSNAVARGIFGQANSGFGQQ